MAIDLTILTQLRNLTGAGVADCRAALAEADGDLERAIEILRKKGAVKAAKKISERTANEGLVESYLHPNGKLGVLIEVRCETDFVAHNADFRQLVHDLAMQVAAASPIYVKPENVPAAEVEKEKEIYRAQLKNDGKPEAMWEKIILGKLQKYYQEMCLLRQPFIKDDSLTVEQLVTDSITKLGEKIEVVAFTRYQI